MNTLPPWAVLLIYTLSTLLMGVLLIAIAGAWRLLARAGIEHSAARKPCGKTEPAGTEKAKGSLGLDTPETPPGAGTTLTHNA